ncbi:3'(2'),5'-bisphosphate nucleotidase CysQ [Pontibacter akesuensis]|uniref:3'(2'),5'-bisphosphate nucleotidase CysQ n=1 Tax=Pontibacter akesuensis TaxID=388950 RepID=A0A1I7FHU5_9BACT|nr:3'(2'),5'-bisphosphate nucleotidase CysQ [Pontibacter akesuensis]GHA62091.1 3'(2'),5'-bisphosphate nucleotidase CysQ [Pontibacter akesuensis]SFU35782.1 3'(2'),5'-bisphosphate nucleotidase [Pontibacter akesuensis]
MDISELVQIAREAALKAGEAILKVYASGDFDVNLKTDDSPLTKADKAAHSIITAYLQKTGLPILSEEGAQTDFQERTKWPLYWLVDPLDGTKEFIKRNGEFTVNIALMQDNIPVAGVIFAPVPQVLYYGSKETKVYKEAAGKKVLLHPLQEKLSIEALLQKDEVIVVASRSHLSPETEQFIHQFKNVRLETMGSSFKLMLLAENKADIYPRFAPTMEWDTAAGHAILRAVNRSVYQADLQHDLEYNKPNLLNPSFVAY